MALSKIIWCLKGSYSKVEYLRVLYILYMYSGLKSVLPKDFVLGLPFVFGMNVQNKPYILVTEFYGIDGQCVTLANALKGRLTLNVLQWASLLGKISEALSHIHSKGYTHGDIKSDNIVIRSACGSYMPIIIDFGKAKKSGEAKKYKLTKKKRNTVENTNTLHQKLCGEVIPNLQPVIYIPSARLFHLYVFITNHVNCRA